MVAVMYTTWIHTQSKRMKGEKKKDGYKDDYTFLPTSIEPLNIV